MKNKNYEQFYQRISSGIRETRYGVTLLRLINQVLTLAMYILYPFMIITMLLRGFLRSGSLTDAVQPALPYIIIPGISFVLLSIIRDRLNWKRPYEEHNIQPLIIKKTKGHSMPSRHVFSCTIIAMCILAQNVPAGITALLLSVLLCAARVLAGVHYPRDVLAGFMIGALAGCLLFLFV